MDAQLLQFSVVVVGRTHNPSLLNPDFLVINNIVQKAWGWEVAETITTPPLAMVRYTTGVTVTVEHNKFQVADVDVRNKPIQSKAAAIARCYVETLPHVRYTAVGLNFQSAVDAEIPGQLLKERFLKPGAWDGPGHTVAGVGLRLVYPLDGGGRLVMSLDAGETEKIEGDKTCKKSVVLVNGNFHKDCQSYPAKDQVLKYIDEAGKHWITYQARLEEVLRNKE